MGDINGINNFLNCKNKLFLENTTPLTHELRQGDTSTTEYYHSLTRHWQQLNIYEHMMW